MSLQSGEELAIVQFCHLSEVSNLNKSLNIKIRKSCKDFLVPSSSSVFSAQVQVLHCKHRNLGSSSASFSNPYIASPTSQLILRRFTHVTVHSKAFPLSHLRHRHFTYVTTHSPTLPPLHLRHSSFYNPSAASPTSGHSTTILLLHLRHKLFTYFTWRAAHA